MSIKSKPFYWLECDEPGCGVKSTEGGEFDAWSDAHQAVDDADASDWLITGVAHFCFDHAAKNDPELAE
jgi:hypothetical protein